MNYNNFRLFKFFRFVVFGCFWNVGRSLLVLMVLVFSGSGSNMVDSFVFFVVFII